VFVLRAVEELTVEETAEVLDIPEATVRTRFFRARALLRESIARQVDFAVEDAFGFAGARCERVTAAVLARLAAEPA
jgi:RNA polymerase sigma-70 factor (ECF subfamily)